MKTIALKSLTIGIFSSIICISCSKTDNAAKSQTELLTQRSWKFEMYGLDENNNGVIEQAENGMLDCEADDVYTFNANGTGVYAGGSLQCSADEPPTIDFGWTFSNNGTELAIFAAPEKINKLDENVLEVYYIDQNSHGQPVKYIRRFQH
jgi:hypothetical protein